MGLLKRWSDGWEKARRRLKSVTGVFLKKVLSCNQIHRIRPIWQIPVLLLILIQSQFGGGALPGFFCLSATDLLAGNVSGGSWHNPREFSLSAQQYMLCGVAFPVRSTRPALALDFV